MTTLKEILTEENKMLELLTTNNGELSDEQSKELDTIMLALCHKIDAYASVFESLEKRAEAFKSQADFFDAATKSIKGAAKRLKDHLKTLMEATSKDVIEGDYVRFTLSNGKPALVINEDLDPAYLMQITQMVPDKKRIEEDLKLGVKIKGAFFKETKTLRKGIKQ